jgi:hypothetical protein
MTGHYGSELRSERNYAQFCESFITLHVWAHPQSGRSAIRTKHVQDEVQKKEKTKSKRKNFMQLRITCSAAPPWPPRFLPGTSWAGGGCIFIARGKSSESRSGKAAGRNGLRHRCSRNKLWSWESRDGPNKRHFQALHGIFITENNQMLVTGG